MTTTSNETKEPQDPATVMTMLRRQRNSYRDLRRLAERQRRLIAQDDSSELLAVLGQRQKLTQELVTLGQGLAPVRANWSSARAALSPEDRAEAEALLAEAKDLLGRLIEDDERDAKTLSARKSQVATEMTGLRGDRRAVAAYAAAQVKPSGRLDQMSEGS